MKTKSQLVNRNAKYNTNTRVCISLFMCVCVRVSVRKFIENVCQRRRKENMGGRD